VTSVQAVNVNDITKISAGIILGLLVIGGILFLAIGRLLARLVIVVVVVGLGVAIWLQRINVTDQISKNKCNFGATFFGFHLDAPKDIKQACAQKQ
jgi:hypothetical protein